MKQQAANLFRFIKDEPVQQEQLKTLDLKLEGEHSKVCSAGDAKSLVMSSEIAQRRLKLQAILRLPVLALWRPHQM